MTWLINGGTTTGFCIVDGGEVLLLNAFLHPASERFLFNADRRLRDARSRQPSRIFRRRLTACSPRRGPSLPEAVMTQVRSSARPVPARPFRTPDMRSSP
jgi:hypothetical protein